MKKFSTLEKNIVREGYIEGLKAALRIILESHNENLSSSEERHNFDTSLESIYRLVSLLYQNGVLSAQFITKNNKIIGFAVTSKRSNTYKFRIDYNPSVYPHHQTYDGIYKGAVVIFQKNKDGERFPELLVVFSEKTNNRDSTNVGYHISNLS